MFRKLKDRFFRVQWGYLLFAVLFIASGLCFVVFPEESVQWVCIVIGALTLLGAILNFVNQLVERRRGFGFALNVIFCVLAGFCGAFLIFNHERGVEFLAIAVGLLMIIDGSFKLQTTVKAKRYHFINWWVMLGFAVGNIGLGLWMIKWPLSSVRAMAVLLGIGMIVDGVQNLLTLFYANAIVSRAKKAMGQPDVNDTVYVDADQIDTAKEGKESQT